MDNPKNIPHSSTCVSSKEEMEDSGCSGYGENPRTGEILGAPRKQQVQVVRKRRKSIFQRTTYVHPMRDNVHEQIVHSMVSGISLPK